MANEFGNTGAISRSQTRLNAKSLEVGTSVDGAEYEAFYGGYWRDISSDFSYDTTKAGNTIARCIRWDDGFRSYREDRGLIIRKKEDSPEDEQPAESDIVSFGKSFATSTGISTGIALANNTFKNILEPALAKTKLGSYFANKPVKGFGSFLSQNKVALAFTGINFLSDTGQSTSEKLGTAALSLGLGITLGKLTPRLGVAGLFVGPAIGALQGLMAGESSTDIAGRVAGHFAGRSIGNNFSNKIFSNKSNNISMDEYLKSGDTRKAQLVRNQNIRAADKSRTPADQAKKEQLVISNAVTFGQKYKGPIMQQKSDLVKQQNKKSSGITDSKMKQLANAFRKQNKVTGKGNKNGNIFR